MKILSLVFYFLCLCMSIAFLVLFQIKEILVINSLTFNYLIYVLNAIYYFFMIIYTIVENQDSSNCFLEFNRDMVYQVLFIFNLGYFQLFGIYLANNLIGDNDYNRFRSALCYLTFIIFLIDYKFTKKTNGGYSPAKIFKICVIIILIFFLLSLFVYLKYNYNPGLYSQYLMIILFSGFGFYALFFHYKPYENILDFSVKEKEPIDSFSMNSNSNVQPIHP